MIYSCIRIAEEQWKTPKHHLSLRLRAPTKKFYKKTRPIPKVTPFFFNMPVRDIFLWNDPITSGLVFGILVLFLLLITYCEYSVVTLVAYFFETLIIAGFGYTMYHTLVPRLQGKSNYDNPLKYKLLVVLIFQGQNRSSKSLNFS